MRRIGNVRCLLEYGSLDTFLNSLSGEDAAKGYSMVGVMYLVESLESENCFNEEERAWFLRKFSEFDSVEITEEGIVKNKYPSFYFKQFAYQLLVLMSELKWKN